MNAPLTTTQSAAASRRLLRLILACLPVTALAQDAPAPVTDTLAELARQADLVAVVQVADTDYEYTRGFPSGGTAFLKVLIPYKVSRPLEDLIEVYEEGLHEGECYFQNPTVFEEGRRHLVFLRFSPDVDEQYNGLPAGCALDVLVTRENRYALRYPVTGIPLSDELSPHARPLAFADPYARVAADDLAPDVRDDLLQSGLVRRDGEFLRYTHGIGIATARELMGPDALTHDRSLK